VVPVMHVAVGLVLSGGCSHMLGSWPRDALRVTFAHARRTARVTPSVSLVRLRWWTPLLLFRGL
jgi:hypothetical protein